MTGGRLVGSFRIWAALAILCLASAWLGAGMPGLSPAGEERAASNEPNTGPGTAPWAAIGSWLQAEADRDLFSGAVLLARGDEILYQGAFGWADREAKIAVTGTTPFNICSMGKMLTAVVALQLVDEGKLSLETPIAAYLPDFPRPAADRITLHHLLSHTSGLGNHMARPGFDREAPGLTTIAALYRPILREIPSVGPGARFSYSNSGFIVAGRIIENVAGRSYFDEVKRRVLDPVAMTRTRFFRVAERPAEAARGYVPAGGGRFLREPQVIPNPASDGGVHSTPGDLLRFACALFCGRLLPEPMRRRMTTPNLNGYGYGLSIKPPDEHVSNRTSFGHTGGLYDRSAVLRFFPSAEVTIIVLANTPNAAFAVAREMEKRFFEASGAGDEAPRGDAK